jgi:hypothetical protein
VDGSVEAILLLLLSAAAKFVDLVDVEKICC